MQLRSFCTRNAGFIIWSIFLVAGMCTFSGYGISWDEEAQRYAAQVSYDYIIGKDDFLLRWDNRDYGVVFELLLLGIEKVLHLKGLNSIYWMRHLVTHLFFLSAAWCFYLLAKRIFKHPFIAVIGLLLFLLHPRIYADSFYNSKDLPFLSMYTICLYCFARAFDRQKAISFWMLGVVSGLLIDIRILGVLFFVSVLFFLLGSLVKAFRQREEVRRYLWQGIVYCISTALTVYLFWPFLWVHPVDGLLLVWKNMSVFSRWDASVLFNGQFIHSSQIPWYYLPVWIIITTPLFYLLTALSGLGVVLFHVGRKPFVCWSEPACRMRMLALITCLGPILSVIVLHSVVYDAWRQVFFVYPALVLLALFGMDHFIPLMSPYKLFPLLLTVGAASPAVLIIRSFPLSNVYFNALAGSSPDYIRHHWEMDYWGLSFRKGLQYILDHDTSAHIVVRYRESPCAATRRIFFEHNTRLELQHVEETEANIEKYTGDYFITNYRLFPYDFEHCRGREIYSVFSSESRVCTIFKLR